MGIIHALHCIAFGASCFLHCFWSHQGAGAFWRFLQNREINWFVFLLQNKKPAGNIFHTATREICRVCLLIACEALHLLWSLISVCYFGWYPCVSKDSLFCCLYVPPGLPLCSSVRVPVGKGKGVEGDDRPALSRPFVRNGEHLGYYLQALLCAKKTRREDKGDRISLHLFFLISLATT